MGMSTILSGVSGVGNLVGGGKASSSQQNAQNQSNQMTQQAIDLIKQFTQTAAPYVQSLLNGTNPLLRQGEGITTSLMNWNGLKPEEMNALTTNAANSGMSDINTARSQGAFGANQNSAIMNALQSNRNNAQTAAVNVGAQAAGQELGALESAGSQTQGLEGVTQGGLSLLSPGNTGAGTAAGMGQSLGQTAAGYGNPYSGAVNSIGTLLGTLPNSQPAGNTPVPTYTGGGMDYQGTSPLPGQAGSW